MSARFRIKRAKPFNPSDRRPWKLADRERPAFIGDFVEHADAIAAIDKRLAHERDVASLRAARAGVPCLHRLHRGPRRGGSER